MDVDRIADVAGIAARHRDRHGDASVAAQRKHHRVARGETVLRECQTTEAVIREGIGAGEIDREVRAPRGQRVAHAILEGDEVLVVGRAVGQFDVEVARFLAEGKIVRAVDREREHRDVLREDRRRAVALVHVAVEDRDALRPAFRLHRERGDGTVVEHAVALPAIAEGVVRAAGEVHPDAAFERRAARLDRGARRAPRTLDHLRRPRESDALHFRRRQRAVDDPLQVAAVVRAQQLDVGRGMRHRQRIASGEPRRVDERTQPRVLLHREAVSVGERQDEVIGVEDLQGEGVRRQALGVRRWALGVRPLASPRPEQTV